VPQGHGLGQREAVSGRRRHRLRGGQADAKAGTRRRKYRRQVGLNKICQMFSGSYANNIAPGTKVKEFDIYFLQMDHPTTYSVFKCSNTFISILSQALGRRSRESFQRVSLGIPFLE
jgi:hypothetical protein